MWLTYVHEYHSSNETESLTIASVYVRDGVAMEDVGQGPLTPSASHRREIGVGGERYDLWVGGKRGGGRDDKRE